jgi:hypothetical protein
MCFNRNSKKKYPSNQVARTPQPCPSPSISPIRLRLREIYSLPVCAVNDAQSSPDLDLIPLKNLLKNMLEQNLNVMLLRVCIVGLVPFLAPKFASAPDFR